VTSYTRGINGIAIDVIALPLTAEAAIAGMLGLKVGNGGDPAAWPSAPPPVRIDLRPGHGVGGSDRILLFWRDGAIRNNWLEVTVPETDITGPSARDAFYFGNLIGETGDRGSPLRASAVDLAAVRRNLSGSGQVVALTNPYDFNRDGKVNALDLATVRTNLFHALRPVETHAAAAMAAAMPRLWDGPAADLPGRKITAPPPSIPLPPRAPTAFPATSLAGP
jgi:hypothetical protein